MVDPAARQAELDKYVICYRHDRYAMGANRRRDCERLFNLASGETYLDVGCGRGEMLDYAEAHGYRVQGVETVPALTGERVIRALGHELPFADDSFDVVSMFDVIEHLLPGDDEAVCRELARVSKRFVLLTASNRPSICPDTGADLHINKRAYSEWDALFREWFRGDVIWKPLARTICPPEMQWLIKLG